MTVGLAAVLLGVALASMPIASSITEPTGIFALVLGAVLAVVIDRNAGLLTYPIRLARKDHFIGTWWEYHLSYLNDNRVLRRSRLSIRRGLRTSVRHVTFWHVAYDSSGKPRRELNYKGTMTVENDQLLIELDAKTHAEHLVYRFIKRIPSNTEVPGLWMSFDHDGRVAAGAAILSARELTDDEAESKILSFTLRGAGVLRIRH